MKYIPDEFLDNKQKTAKKEALVKDDDDVYLSAVDRGDIEAAQKMVDEAAKAVTVSIPLLLLYEGEADTLISEKKDDLESKEIKIAKNAILEIAGKLGEIKNDQGHKDASPVLTGDDRLSRSVGYSLSQIVPFVNSKDLLRYLPDGMLNKKQRNIMNVIPLSERINAENDDIRYSARTEDAENRTPDMSDIARSTEKIANARRITVETQDFAIQAIIDQTHNFFTSYKTLAVNASRSKSRPSEQNKKCSVFSV